MQAWWRVLKGVWPYRWMVVISFLCALGVGLSYASGVVVMLPVMKIFISNEQIQGWAHRTATESRLDITTWDLDTNLGYNATGLHISKSGKNAPEPLTVNDEFLSITDVKTTVEGRPQISDETEPGKKWQQIVGLIAHADPGSQATLTVRHKDDTRVVNVPLRDPSLQARGLVYIAGALPKDRIAAFNIMVAFFIFLCFVGSAFRYY